MERRTCEGPMDWEYQSQPPMDQSSPFVKFSQKPSMFSSPLKPRSTNPNPFAFENTPKLSPAKPQDQPRPPFTSSFKPELHNKPTGPAFRNPAFTTPQRRVDDPFSEYESSPAMTDNSPMPADTPEPERDDADVSRLTMTPSPGKTTLLGKTLLRSHAAGRGEILRGNRDKHGSDESDSDWEEDASSKTKKKRKAQGWFSSFLAAVSDHPNAPVILSKWLQLVVNMVLLGIALFGIISVLRQVRADMFNESERAKADIINKMSICAENFRKNGCSPRSSRPPALDGPCNEWEACMNQDASAVMQAQLSARSLANILNEFVGVLSFKTWGFILSIFLGAVIASNVGFNSLRNSAIPQPEKPAAPLHSAPAMPMAPMLGPAAAHNPNQAYIWAPLSQTPRHVRKAYFPNDVTDSEASPDMKMIMPPQTPSGRRSPSKGDRGRNHGAVTGINTTVTRRMVQGYWRCGYLTLIDAKLLVDVNDDIDAVHRPAHLQPQPGILGREPPRKRRIISGPLTSNACTQCQRRRSKCDGQHPCGRCSADHSPDACEYRRPERQSKDQLRHEIEQLRRRQRDTDRVLAMVARTDQLGEIVLERLRAGQSAEHIAAWLGGEGHSPADWPPEGYGGLQPPGGQFVVAAAAEYGAPPAPTEYGMIPEPGAPEFGSPIQQHRQSVHGADPWGDQFLAAAASQTLPPTQASGGSHVGPAIWSPKAAAPDESWAAHHVIPNFPPIQQTWTTVTNDITLVHHLLSLYFCWEYPTFASLSKEHFLADFQAGRPRWCSPMLVNALLALGCRFSSQPKTRADPRDPRTSGDHFFAECLRLYRAEEDHHKLTTVQALGVMSIREASCGRDEESWFYAGQSIKLAVEMGLHHLPEGVEGHDEETEVREATFWGAFALDHAWSLATGSLPRCSRIPHLPPKPAVFEDLEASRWVPYTDDGVPLQHPSEQPSNVRSVFKCFCELSELVHKSLYMLYSPGRVLTSRDLLDIYTRFVNWYDGVPDVLRLGHNFTPAVLFSHMYYHFAILLLFRPLIKLRILNSPVVPREVCSEAANAISGLLRSYARLYTLRRTPSFIPYFALAAAVMHLALAATDVGDGKGGSWLRGSRDGFGSGDSGGNGNGSGAKPAAAEALARGIADLTEMAPCHHFAEQALSILRCLARKWKIDVEVKTPAGEAEGRETPLERVVGPDDDQPTRPVTASRNFFATNFDEEDFHPGWRNDSPSWLEGRGCPRGDGKKRRRSNGLPEGGKEESEEEKADALLAEAENPLFWPFPLQGRPMVPAGKALEEAGFVFL
ncbi:hypothetical protein VTJ49DRAFT_780 [Mycothermus thermophilus]|uniref:Zn(2)-C6 fungal-type domain-containing protein n=1 Tax=Humicola insolens TaxID=85995 RepID=A0ABR3VEG1_HUMIN